MQVKKYSKPSAKGKASSWLMALFTKQRSTENHLSFEMFLKMFLMRPYHPQDMNVILFLPQGDIKGDYTAFYQDLSSEEAHILEKTLDDILQTGHSLHLTLKTLSGFSLEIYGSSLGTSYIMFLLPISKITENLQAEQKKSKALLKKISALQHYCDVLPIPFWCRDDKQNFIFTNKAYKDLTEGGTNELIHKTKAHFLAQSALLHKNTQSLEATSICHGKRYDFKIHEMAFNDDNDMVFTVGYAVDISEFCDLRQKYNHTQTGQRDILGHLCVALILFDERKNILFYNQAFLDLWGLNNTDLQAHSDHPSLLELLRSKRLLPEQRDIKQWRHTQFASYTDSKTLYKDRWHLPDGRIIAMTSTGYGNGNVVSFYEDITKHFTLERVLENSVKNLQETLDSLDAQIALFDVNCKLKVFNKGMNYLASNLLQHGIHLSKMAEILQNHHDISTFCYRLIDMTQEAFLTKDICEIVKDKTQKTYYLHAERLESGDILMTFRDISAQTHYEDVLSARTEALAELSHIREMLFRQISFQLREPMTVISGFSEVLHREMFGTLNQKQAEYVGDIRKASGRILELIDNLADLVRLDGDDETLRKGFSSLDLDKIIKSAISCVHSHIEDKNIAIDYHISSPYIKIYGDFSALRQVFIQILLNSIQASPKNSVISLKIFQKEEKNIISIKDEGCGLSQEIIDYIQTGHYPDLLKGYGLRYIKRMCALHHIDFKFLVDNHKGTDILLEF